MSIPGSMPCRRAQLIRYEEVVGPVENAVILAVIQPGSHYSSCMYQSSKVFFSLAAEQLLV